MKKALALIITMCISISATACGNATASSKTSSSTTDNSTSKWPSASVQYIVPAKSGGGTDLVSRVYTTWLNEKTGKGMVVTNQSDGGGAIAASTVANAKPDGNTLMFAHTGSLISAATGTISNDMVEDYTTIAYIPSVTNYCLVVNGKSDIKSIEDLVAAAKAEPGKVTLGVALGASTHMMAASIAKDADVTFNYVEAGSDTEKISALAGGHIMATLVNPNNAKQFEDSGDVRVIAVLGSSDERCETFPDVPALKELGYDSCTFSVDFVVWGPKNMNPNDVQKIHDFFAEATEDTAVLEQCNNMNFPIQPCLGLEEGHAKLAEVNDQYTAILTELGLAK